jgi:hypothetical protein
MAVQSDTPLVASRTSCSALAEIRRRQFVAGTIRAQVARHAVPPEED